MKGTLLFLTFFVFYSFCPKTTDDSLGNTKWVQAGKSFVNAKLDNVSIFLHEQDSEFIALRLVFEGEAVRVHHFIIHYEDGKSKRYLLKKKCGDGFKSRIVNFEGGARTVKKVDVWYTANPLAVHPSTIYLWGKG